MFPEGGAAELDRHLGSDGGLQLAIPIRDGVSYRAEVHTLLDRLGVIDVTALPDDVMMGACGKERRVEGLDLPVE